MPVLLVLGAVLIGSGIVLICVPRRSGSTKAWAEFSAASLGRIGRVLDRIIRIDGALVGLERAMDAVIPARNENEISTARCNEVATAYAEAGHRLVELARVHLRAVPSTGLMRFTELSSAVERRPQALDHEPPNCAACISLMRHLDAVGNAIRTDHRRLRLTSEPADVLLRELACALRIALTTHLDMVAVALAKRRAGTARALRKRDRAALAECLDHAQMQLKAIDWLAFSDPLAALQALAALPLPIVVGVPRDTLAAACSVVAAGLNVSAAGRDACLDERIAHYAAAIDRHLRDLLPVPNVVTAIPRMRPPDHDQFDVPSLTSR